METVHKWGRLGMFLTKSKHAYLIWTLKKIELKL